jgi:starvation-inducible DNA-binding protein
MNLADVLRALLCDVFAFYTRAHAAHWNVVGPDFAQYHALFGDIAADTYGSVDPLAENVRKLDGFTPSTIGDLAAGCVTAPAAPGYSTTALAGDLLLANDRLLTKLRLAFSAADAVNEQGVANFLAERIDAHQKWRWFLKSSTSVTIDAAELVVDLG